MSAPLHHPLLALAGWTLLVQRLMPLQRTRAIRRGQATVADFRYGESTRVPDEAHLANRNYMNLLEAPLLFHVLCLLALVRQRATATLLALAWAYVALRVLHSLVHRSYNRVTHRLALFAASNGVLWLLWLQLVLAEGR